MQYFELQIPTKKLIIYYSHSLYENHRKVDVNTKVITNFCTTQCSDRAVADIQVTKSS